MTEQLGIEFEVDTGNSGAEVEVGLVVEVDIDSLRAVFELEVGMVVEVDVDSLGAEVDIEVGIESLVGQDIVEVGKNTVLVDDLEEGPLLDIEMTLMEI